MPHLTDIADIEILADASHVESRTAPATPEEYQGSPVIIMEFAA
ncbi:MAG TPA: hypothetical protein VMV94_20255 [Phycisphaerae bacterium]|nr:hypothetical protein [Phycisphaerae bacterium]